MKRLPWQAENKDQLRSLQFLYDQSFPKGIYLCGWRTNVILNICEIYAHKKAFRQIFQSIRLIDWVSKLKRNTGN
ncbi:hypothetical protein HMPREF3213_02020 [Heyndrickxia coagulans]|uniref:Uncharacterized protein n=1 Tax=Heyndrickxia coagulans TaxID=1398 RepID=A0A133KPG6_HEYCO|nr:hypothetical protein HMPREF3213_02020 [Heyndrickxia coagulans]